APLDKISRHFGRHRKALPARDRSCSALSPWSENQMKIAVIGGTGLIGKKVVSMLHRDGHEVVTASDVNNVAGNSLAETLTGTPVVVDVANAPSFGQDAVISFSKASHQKLLRTGMKAGVGHHVALSVVGADRIQSDVYMRGKLAQEELIKDSGMPYTI